jgi:hypothetical protein
MAAHEPLPRTVDAVDVNPSWSDALAAVSRRGERVAVQEDGVTVAVLVSVQDLEQLARLDARREAFFETLERIGQAFAHETPEESVGSLRWPSQKCAKRCAASEKQKLRRDLRDD